MNIKFTKSLTVLAAFLTILIFADASSAQRRARGTVYTKAQVDKIIDRVETRLDKFVSRFDNALDNSSLDDTRREDVLNARAKNLEEATDKLRSEFNRRDRWVENKDEVRRCLNIASGLNGVIVRRKFDSRTENIWAEVRYELNTLAKVYNLPTVGAAAYK